MKLHLKKNSKEPSSKDINLILELFTSNKIIEAKLCVDKEIQKYPNSSILLNILGAIFVEQNKLNEAIENYKNAIKINPNYFQAYNNLGIAFSKLNKFNDSIDSYKKAININSNFAEAYNNLGNAFVFKDDLRKALENFEKALKINTSYSEAYNNLGYVNKILGKEAEALNCYQQAIKFKPDYAQAYNNIGIIFNDRGNFDEALKSYKKATRVKPNYAKSYKYLGNLLNDLGQFDEATAAYNQAIKIKPDYHTVYSNLLFNLNYKTDFDPKLYLSIAKKFRLNCKIIKKNLNFKYKYEKKPKKIKIGLVSADFGDHPGGYFTLSTFKKLNNKNIDLIAYSTFDRSDKISEQFKDLFLKWNSIEKKEDFKIVEEISNDGIHILIDLQGHSGKNRLPLFMHKPAPIQVSWLSQGSTGIPEIDYFIGSPHTTPKKEEKNYVEKIIRLPDISQSFTAPDYAIDVNNLPALKNNFITFGCINKLAKINDNVINLWSKILLSISNSKLILKNKHFDNKNVVKSFFQKFKKHNVNKNQLDFRGSEKTREEVLKVYNEIDISLDPFPYQGNTSTCESVWMGVPVITLKGSRYLSHFGESINSNLNMKNWIANNEKEYVDKAINYSAKFDELAEIRKTLRETALNSPVFDESKFANHFDKMLWNLWENFTKNK